MINATRKQDLNALAQRIASLPLPTKRWLAPNTVLRELMHEPTLFTIREIFSGHNARSQKIIDDAIILLFQRMDEEEVDRFISGLTKHLIEGTDQTENSTAVGGFNQNELNALEELVILAEQSHGG